MSLSLRSAESTLAAPLRRAWQLGDAGPPCGSAPQVKAARGDAGGYGDPPPMGSGAGAWQDLGPGWGEACGASEMPSGSWVPRLRGRFRVLPRRSFAGHPRFPFASVLGAAGSFRSADSVDGCQGCCLPSWRPNLLCLWVLSLVTSEESLPTRGPREGGSRMGPGRASGGCAM